MAQQIVVGVDGGGSKTHVIVATPRGKVLAEVTGDASAVAPGEALGSAEVIGALVRDALAQAGKELGLQIRIQRSDIFEAMHEV